ncbi:MAG TPA: DNA-directed RNA polymerase subunit alpha [Bacteroidota bacterium]
MLNANFQMPEKIELDEASYSHTFGRFIVQPLERGFGVTLGNAFRRVLLSSLSGTAITAIKIDGVHHEFTQVPGVVEDVSDLVLNLKQVRLKQLNKKSTKVTIPLKGPKDFTAGDIQKHTTDFEVLNPEQHIAKLNGEAEFELELRIGRGKGYVPSEENKAPDQAVGVIAIDSIFTPISNVRYFVESTRVGQKTDYEKLILEIETDGSLTPDDALAQAAKILRDHIQLFINFDVEPEAEKEVSEQDSEVARIRKILKMPVDELELSVRSHNCLRAANIKTIADLVRRDESDLLKFRNFGRKSLAELSTIIEVYGLSFGMDVDRYLKDGSE